MQHQSPIQARRASEWLKFLNTEDTEDSENDRTKDSVLSVFKKSLNGISGVNSPTASDLNSAKEPVLTQPIEIWYFTTGVSKMFTRIHPSSFLILVATLSVGMSGCLLNHSHHVVVRQDEPLYASYFESDHGREVYEGYVRNQIQNNSKNSRSSFGIPFIISAERSHRIAENAVRNDAAIRFDRNSDGLISDEEASRFQTRTD